MEPVAGREGTVQTEIWESDPFTEKRVELLETLETDYRWEKGDTFLLTRGGRRQHYRVIRVDLEIAEDGLCRAVLGLRVD